MDKVKNINRYWLDNDSRIVARQWTEEEYKTIDPHTHIFEKYWSCRCPRCEFLPVLCHDEAEARHHGSNHEHYCGSLHKCIVEYRDFELNCWEFKEEYNEEFDIWVAKQEVY